jgi:cation diffusion facilitator CzcD-associated flavoprotein CzcO
VAIARATSLSASEPALRRGRHAIVGAGPAGLGVARAFQERGLEVDILERHQRLGGIWDPQNPGSPMYASAHFISSKTLSGYTDYGFPDSAAEYPSHEQVLAFLNGYADRYDLRRSIEYGLEVTRVEPAPGNCTVKLADGRTRIYDGVVLATGFQWVPNLPDYPGMSDFQGTSLHAQRYFSPEIFENKRVLIVGCGASGVDIANDAAVRARATFLSMRRGHHFVPKHLFGVPTDVWGSGGLPLPSGVRQFLLSRLLKLLLGDPTRYGLPAPDHRILERPPILSSQIFDNLSHGRLRAKPDVEAVHTDGARFVDGSQEELDVIVYCTGYRECWPVVENSVLRPTGEGDLDLNLFHRRFPNLFVAGLLRSNAGGFAVFEAQGRAVAELVAAGAAGPARLRRILSRIGSDQGGGIRYQKNEYQSPYLDAATYRRRLERVFRLLREGSG